MSLLITDAAISQYSMEMTLAIQQKASKLTPYVNIQPQAAKNMFFDRVGVVDTTEITSQHQDIVQSNAAFTRRRCTLRAWEVSDLTDPFKALEAGGDGRFQQAYIESQVAAMMRRKDKQIVDAVLGTAYGGTDGNTAIPFDTNNTVAVNYVESGSATNSGLTIGKWRKAIAILEENEVDTEAGLVLVIGPKQKQNLLATTEITSSDYAAIKALVNGEINSFLGCDVVMLNGKISGSSILPVDSNSYKRCFLMTKDCVNLCIGQDVLVDVSPRRDKSGHPIQTYSRMFADAARMWEEKVVEIKCLEV